MSLQTTSEQASYESAPNPFQALVDFAVRTVTAEWDHYQCDKRKRSLPDIAFHSRGIEQTMRRLIAAARVSAPLLSSCFTIAEVNARLDTLAEAILRLSTWERSATPGLEFSKHAEYLGQLDRQVRDARLRVQDLADIAALAPTAPPAAKQVEEGSENGKPPPAAVHGEGAGAKAKGKLRPCWEKAYRQNQRALEHKPDLGTDRDAYNWLRDEDTDTDEGDLPPLCSLVEVLAPSTKPLLQQ